MVRERTPQGVLEPEPEKNKNRDREEGQQPEYLEMKNKKRIKKEIQFGKFYDLTRKAVKKECKKEFKMKMKKEKTRRDKKRIEKGEQPSSAGSSSSSSSSGSSSEDEGDDKSNKSSRNKHQSDSKPKLQEDSQGVRQSTDTIEYCLTDSIQYEQDLTTFPVVTLDQSKDILDRKAEEREGLQDPVHIEQEDSEDQVERRSENEEIGNGAPEVVREIPLVDMTEEEEDFEITDPQEEVQMIYEAPLEVEVEQPHSNKEVSPQDSIYSVDPTAQEKDPVSTDQGEPMVREEGLLDIPIEVDHPSMSSQNQTSIVGSNEELLPQFSEQDDESSDERISLSKNTPLMNAIETGKKPTIDIEELTMSEIRIKFFSLSLETELHVRHNAVLRKINKSLKVREGKLVRMLCEKHPFTPLSEFTDQLQSDSSDDEGPEGRHGGAGGGGD